MKEHFVIDPLISKRQQLLLATQLCRMVLKVCFVPVFYPDHLLRPPLPQPLPFSMLRVTALPRFPPRLADLAQSNIGEAGKRPHASPLARYTRQAPSTCVTLHCRGDCIYKLALHFPFAFFVSLTLFSEQY
jgi:hypothetical protein